jgi:capsular exopolysaccharide synthesis family protein
MGGGGPMAYGSGLDSSLNGGLQILPLPYYTSQTMAPDRDELDLRQMLQVLRRRAWLIGGVAVAITLVSWLGALTRRPIYQGGFQVLVEDNTNADAASELLSPVRNQRLDLLEYNTQLQVLKGSALLEPIHKRLQEKYPDLAYGSLIGNLDLGYLKGTKILSVTYQGEDPSLVKAVLEEVSEGYLRHSLQQQQDTLHRGIQFVEEQLPKLRERVSSLQKNLEVFRQEYSLVDPESRGSEISGLLNTIQSQQQSTQLELTEAQSLYLLLQQQLGSDVTTAVASAALSESGHYQGVLVEIEGLEKQIALESARFREDSPQIQALMDRRNNLTQLLNIEAERVLGGGSGIGLNDRMTSIPLGLTQQLVSTTNTIQLLQIRNQALSTAENQLKQEFALIPSLSRQYTDLQRELQVATESLNRFLSTRETLQIENSQQSTPWQVISEPFASTVPISPNIPRNLGLGLTVGLLVGIGTGFLRDRLDNVFHSLEELKELIKLPIIGIIPYSSELEEQEPGKSKRHSLEPIAPGIGGQLQNPRWQAPLERAGKTYGYGYGSSPFQEAFRLLYSNVRFLSSDNPVRSIVISSALPGDGKSTVSVYTAHAAAAMGQRVLIVDADMRRPKLHHRLNLNNMRGLSNVLANNLDPEQAIQTLDANLSVLTAGHIPPDPTNLLSSKRMQHLIGQFQEDFDLVIYDTPPLLGLADGSLLATHLDGVLLVVGLGKTQRSAIKSVIDNLKVSSVPTLGVVANGLTQSSTYGSGYYYDYYHSYYHGAPQKEAVNAH